MMSLLVAVLTVVSCVSARNLTIPDGFMFGAATAAYQVEGAWNTSGKGESIWDYLFHEYHMNETGDEAADSYHHYKEDVQAAKTIGLSHYRFSISWARILPNGDLSHINQDGIDYYNNLINELQRNNITPVVTIYHWDLPQHIQLLGGFVNDIFIDYYVDYARILFTNFGDRVKYWVTFNEPLVFVAGYGSGLFPPAVTAVGVGDYLAAHNMLKAHARAYHLYSDQFRSRQGGKIGITLSLVYPQPKTNSAADLDAAERYFQFNLGWFAHPIYSTQGDYPAVMKERVANNSRAEGLPRSRLPEFGERWVEYIRGSYDFYGMNYYQTYLVSASNSTSSRSLHNDSVDMGPVLVEPYPADYVPFGLRKMLNWVSDHYNKVPILITENGWSDSGEMNDTTRIKYLVNHYAAVMDAINEDNVTVIGHTAWSLIDTFEWNTYSEKYGLYRVNFSDPEKARTPRLSSQVLASIIKTRKLPEEYLDKE